MLVVAGSVACRPVHPGTRETEIKPQLAGKWFILLDIEATPLHIELESQHHMSLEERTVSMALSCHTVPGPEVAIRLVALSDARTREHVASGCSNTEH